MKKCIILSVAMTNQKDVRIIESNIEEHKATFVTLQSLCSLSDHLDSLTPRVIPMTEKKRA